MSNVFDVRPMTTETIKKIVFADQSSNGVHQGYALEEYAPANKVRLIDGTGSFIYLRSKQHALDLKKALDKATELGWLV